MNDYVKVEGSVSLYKDALTGFVSNMDKDALAKAKARKKARQEQENKISNLENEVSELKDMIKALVESK
jgi:hypothetical protein